MQNHGLKSNAVYVLSKDLTDPDDGRRWAATGKKLTNEKVLKIQILGNDISNPLILEG